MMLQTLFVCIILSTFSTSAAAPNRSINCYKYEKNFTDVNFIDPPAEEKDVVKCDQCFSYLCYANGEYILGYGCRDDFFKTCNVNNEDQKFILDGNSKNGCSDPDVVPLFDMCLKDYCSHKRVNKCITKSKNDHPNSKIGPKYTVADITFTQLPTPAPTITPSARTSIKYYKYEKNFTDVNSIDPPVEEKEIPSCDQRIQYYYHKDDLSVPYWIYVLFALNIFVIIVGAINHWRMMKNKEIKELRMEIKELKMEIEELKMEIEDQ